MRFVAVGFLILWMILPVSAARTVVLPELLKPDSIAVDDTRIFITDDIAVLIYARANLQLVKKIGKEGEGPREFMRNRQTGNPPLSIDVQTEHLIVNSMNKISFFSKKGEFIEERKVTDRGDKYVPLGEGFAGEGDRREEKVRYVTVNLYDAGIKKVKEVAAAPHPFQGVGTGFRVLSDPRAFAASGDRLWVAKDADFIVHVFDEKGDAVRVIEKEYQRRPVKKGDRDWIENLFKTDPRLKELYPFLKPLHFPDQYPAIRNMATGDGKMYILTWNRIGDATECFTAAPDVAELKRILLPVRYVDMLDIYPFALSGGEMLQLIENEDEEWELHITSVE